ncbi:winged helix-turn-helix domain-containing protein [Agromyces sp. H3Y2-19a]|jgi:DNA-binding winged helix-turn-helix (wHTH) protein|uniref:winged helix-turn-helix domain-containing protein n=1 Tax=Agromyces chromiiresistens TaxID=3030835 RepID=UPI0023B8D073|nr:winged helix-turn-helix domain-containing protein [Agromyces chromiiresistens]MDF0513790.1 winged helix-turn-helix domain-containing protein [Agromyces chromiiresistens]
MSLALATAPAAPVAPAVRPVQARTAPSLSAAPSAAPLRSLSSAVAAEAAAVARPAAATPAAPRVRAVPEGTEARGFVLYVGIDEAKAAEDGTTLHRIVEALRALTAEVAPSSETYAAVALAPEGAGGRDVDVVRLALQDPAALAKQREGKGTRNDADRHPNGVIIDISRKRVLLDGEAAGLTYKEFELLQYLVLREGRTIDRHELIENLWDADDEAPSERTIDVHVRRLRSKLAHYQDIVRTVRGVGYRFDRHADVSIRQASTPSPDLY